MDNDEQVTVKMALDELDEISGGLLVDADEKN